MIIIEKVFIVTNNKLVKEAYPAYFYEGDFEALLLRVRDFIHSGHALISHPLTGSVKPHETEYKSIILTYDKGSIDFQSLNLIENAIIATRKFKKPIRPWSEEELKRIDQDFMTIDKGLLEAGLEGLKNGRYQIVHLNM